MRAEIVPLPPLADLERRWRDVLARGDGPVFLSWAWIEALLATAPTPPRLITVTAQSRLVGLALLGGQGRRHHLNESGDDALDRVMIEYNGLVCERGMEQAAEHAVLTELIRRRDWGELVLAGVDGHWQSRCAGAGLGWHLLRHPQEAPYRRLDPQGDDDITVAMSRNTRQQIRRSVRYFEQRGPLGLDAAASRAEALDWFAAMEPLHTAHWRNRGQDGAFATPAFARFHRRLISAHGDDGVADLLRVRAGNEILGYLYNLTWRGEVFAYQNGFIAATAPQCRPGLVAHTLAMAHYRQRGLTAYRFLAGDARYKRSLSDRADRLYWMVAYRPGPLRTAERVARAVAGRLRDRLGRRRATPAPHDGGSD